MTTDKHYFTPSDENRDTCARCGRNFRATDVHITAADEVDQERENAATVGGKTK
jgi:hypothetical protein